MSRPHFTPDIRRDLQKLEDDVARLKIDLVALQSGGSGGGGSVSTYLHTQSTPASTWLITHNLDKFPSVTTVDTTDKQVVGSVSYNSKNIVVVTFGSAMAGRAFLN